jgi:hypothetical protein
MYNLYAIHGVLQVIAFAVLFPLGVLVAVFREWIGSSWFVAHVALQSAATLTLIAALACAGVAENANKNKHDHNDHNTSLHVIVGYCVVGLVAFQIVWAVFLRQVVPRPIWLAVHSVLAIGILGTGWTNLYLGYIHYIDIVG